MRSRRTRSAVLALAAGLVIGLAGCGGSGATTGDQETVTVFAAASLTEPFGELEKRFEAAHPDVDVRLSFNGSSDLATQISAGAPADVFASANAEVMSGLGELATKPTTFASNTLEIATAPGNPAGIDRFADLADPDLDVVICAAPVPCGTATAEMERLLGVELTPASEEQSVTDVLGKVTNGQADAGVVYRSDVATAGEDVTGVRFAGADGVVNSYPISRIDGAPAPEAAEEFIDLVLSDEGQQVLREAGFGGPPAS